MMVWKKVAPALNMAIFGIYVKFMGCTCIHIKKATKPNLKGFATGIRDYLRFAKLWFVKMGFYSLNSR